MAIFATKYDKALDAVLGQSDNLRAAAGILGVIGVFVGLANLVISTNEIKKIDADNDRRLAEG